MGSHASEYPPSGGGLVLLRYWPVLAVLIGIYWLESGWAAILLYHVGIGVAVAREWRGLRLARWSSSFPVAAASFVAGLLVGPIILLGLPILTVAGIGEELSTGLDRLGLTGGSLVAFFLYFVLVHPLLEEISWRVILRADSKGLHRHDLEFAAYHILVLHWVFPGHWALLAVAFVGLSAVAWFWRQWRDRHGMVAVIALHAASDLAVLLASFRIAGVSPF